MHLLAPYLLAAGVPGGVWNDVLDLLILLATAMVLGVVAERLRQSAVVGYLLAGTLVGPGVLGWVSSEEHILQIAELGVALLLFTIGLEFSPRQLMQLGRVPLIAGPLQVIGTTAAGMGCALLIDLPLKESLVIGAMTALSSTACVLRVLRDRAEMDSQHGRTSLGILLVQDIAVVPLVLIVTALAGGGTLTQIVTSMTISIVLAFALVAAFYVLFNYVIPHVLIMPTWRRNRDLPVLLTFCLAGGAAWAAHALQLSPALGAFVAGVLLAVTPFAPQIQADIQPLRAVLVTLFFAAIGMFGDPIWLIEHLPLVLAVLGAIVVGKAVIVAIVCYLARLPLQFAVAAGFSLAQIGEFSFVLATIAQDSSNGDSLLSETAFQAIVSATILSLLVTPYLLAAGPYAGSWLERMLRARGWLGGQMPTRTVADNLHRADHPDAEQPADGILDSIFIIGFGPAGQRLAEELLADYAPRLAVLDMNPANLELAQRYGLESHQGDASQTEVLLHCGIQRASVVIVALPNPSVARKLIHLVRQLAPGARIVARSRYHIYRWELLRAGAQAVIDEEDQVGIRLAEEVRRMM